MKRLVVFIFLLHFSIVGKSQFFGYYLEPFIGSIYTRNLKQYEQPLYNTNGGKLIAGGKFILSFGGIFTINTTLGAASRYETLGFFQLTTEVPVYYNRSNKVTFFIEAGIESSEDGDTKLPIYLGVRQKLDNRIAWTLRLRPPLGIDTHKLKWTDNYLIGLEFGLRFQLFQNPWRNVTKFGNPFLLQ